MKSGKISEPLRKGAEKNNLFKGIAEILFGILIIAAVYYFRDELVLFKEFGYFGVFIISLLSAATVLLPAPGWAIVFAMANLLNPIYVGLVAGIGSGMGELTGYLIGQGAKNITNIEERFKSWRDWIRRNDFIAIALLAFIPNPAFDVAGLVAGAFGVPWWRFLVSCVLGRTVRYLLLAYLGAFSLQYL